MNLSLPPDLSTDGSIIGEPLALTVGFDAGAQPKTFKDTAWKLAGGFKAAAGGAELPLEDLLALGGTLPQPTQAADGQFVLTVAPASAGVLTLKLTLTGPKDFLLEAPPVQVTIQPPPTRQELFQRAVASADEEAVARMLGEGPDEGEAWSWLDPKSGVPLLASLGAAPAADEEARLRLLTLLLEAGAVVPATPVRRAAAPSALHCAIYAGEARVLAALLARASPAELAALAASPSSGRVGFTPLHAACEAGDAAAAASLVARGAPLEGPLGTPTPLALCAERADLRMTRQLLGAAADGAARAKLLAVGTIDAAHSALALANAAAAAKPAEAEELVRFLLDQHGAVGCLGFSSQAPSSAQEGAAEAEAMLAAAGHGLHVVVRQLLQRGVDAATPHPDGRSALHDAVAGGAPRALSREIEPSRPPRAPDPSQTMDGPLPSRHPLSRRPLQPAPPLASRAPPRVPARRVCGAQATSRRRAPCSTRAPTQTAARTAARRRRSCRSSSPSSSPSCSSHARWRGCCARAAPTPPCATARGATRRRSRRCGGPPTPRSSTSSRCRCRRRRCRRAGSRPSTRPAAPSTSTRAPRRRGGSRRSCPSRELS